MVIFSAYAGFMGISLIKILVLLGLVLFAVILLLTINEVIQFNKKYTNTLPILEEDKDPEHFILEIEKIIEKTDIKSFRNLLNMSLAAGYCENGDYNEAYQVLTSVDLKKLTDINKAIYYINMFAITYNLGEEEKAIMFLKDNRDLLLQYENHPKIRDFIAINMGYRYLAEKDIDKAKFYLDKAEITCTIPYLNDSIEFLKADIMVNEHNYDEASIILKRLKEIKVTPSLKNNIAKLENIIKLTYS